MGTTSTSSRCCVAVLVVALALAVAGCAGDPQADAPPASREGAENAAAAASPASPAQHDMAESGHDESVDHDMAGADHDVAEHDMVGEEDHYVPEADTYDRTLDGLRLVLAFDPGYAVFQGRLYNEREEPACAVTVEVHLSTGTRLGPTDAVDVGPGASTTLELPAGDAMFPGWMPHLATGACGG